MIKPSAHRLSGNGAGTPEYKLPESAVLVPITDPEKKREDLPESGTPTEDVNVPYRGTGSGVEHGVPITEHPENWEDEYTKAMRAATVPTYEPETDEPLEPFPVHVVSMVPPAKERKTMTTGRDQCTEQRGFLGPDEKRTRLILRVLTTSTSDLYIGDTSDVAPYNGYAVPKDGLEHEYFTNGPLYLNVDSGMTATFSYLVERVVNL